LLLAFAAVFGVLSLTKIRTLRSTAAEAVTAREGAERYRVTKENEVKTRESAITAEQAKLSERESKTLASEEQLKQLLNEKKQVEAKLQDKEVILLRYNSKSRKATGLRKPGRAIEC
jgi:hypothetical protein